MTLQQKVEQIISKAGKLVKHNHKLTAKNDELENELKNLKTQLESEQKKCSELHNQIKIIKLAQNIGSPGTKADDVSELKRKLNEYIREVDNCITMLND